MKKFKRKKVEETEELPSLVFEEMVENLYKDIVTKDLARIKYLLANNIVKEEEIVDAVCFQLLEKRHNSTLIQILLDRKILYGEKYRILEQIPLETLPTVEMQKQISKRNIYIANMLKEYGVVSQQEATKYLQILQRLRQMGLKYDWKKFAETTKLISSEVVDAILLKVQEKIDTVELKLNSTERLLQAKKSSLSIGAKILIFTFTLAVFILPMLLFASASYKTIQDRSKPEVVEEFVFEPVENVTVVEKVVKMPESKINHEKYIEQSGYKKWGDCVVTIDQWNELAKTYPLDKYMDAQVQLTQVQLAEDYEITIKGSLHCPVMPKGLEICVSVKIETFQQKIYYQKIFVDAHNNFIIRIKNKNLLSLGYHTVTFEIVPAEQHDFTRKFLSMKYQGWEILLQVGTKEQIKEQINKEYIFLKDFLGKLIKDTEQAKNFTSFEKARQALPDVLSNIILNTFYIKKVTLFFERWQSLISNNDIEVEQFILELYDIQIYLLKLDREITMYGNYFQKFLLPR